jgi:mono/diheme cytochrome c family protein
MTLFGALLLLAVSYSRDIAPIFAMHCNRCHGDAETAGGLELRTHDALMKSGAIVPGDPDSSQVVQFIEGRRGEEHRMPLGGAPLTAAQIARIRTWITEGAQEDADDAPVKKQTISNVRLRRTEPLRVSCKMPATA